MSLYQSLNVSVAILLCCVGAKAARTHVSRAVENIDPISGLHWQRTTDPLHPAAPPRLKPAQMTGQEPGRAKAKQTDVCVRAGDRVWLRGARPGSSVMLLEVTALQAGARGDDVRARVGVTGALVEMKITGPGAGILGGKVGKW